MNIPSAARIYPFLVKNDKLNHSSYLKLRLGVFLLLGWVSLGLITPAIITKAVVTGLDGNPSNLRSTSATTTSITLAWNDNSTNETGFYVYRNGSRIATLGANTTSYTNTGLICGATYSYYVTGYLEAKAEVPAFAPVSPFGYLWQKLNQLIGLNLPALAQTTIYESSPSNTIDAATSPCPTDTQAPAFTYNPATTQYSNGFTASVTYTDNVAVTQMLYCTTNQPAGSCSPTTLGTQSLGGVYSASYYLGSPTQSVVMCHKAGDAAGNWSPVSCTEWSRYPVAPSNLSATRLTDSTISVSFTDNSMDEQGFYVYRDGNYAGWVNQSNPSSLTGNTMGFTDTGDNGAGVTCGPHTYQALVYNANGWLSQYSAPSTATARACSVPTSYIAFIPSGPVNATGAAYLKTTCYVDAPATCQYQSINDGAWQSLQENNPYALTCTTVGYTNVASVRHKDSYGSISASVSASIICENGPPSGTVSINGGAAATDNPNVTLALACADSGVGCDGYMQVNNNGASNSGCAVSESWSPFSSSLPLTLPSGNGTKYVSVKFRDKAGNTTCVTDSINLLIDTTPPNVSVTCPSGYTNTATAATSYTATDSESAVTSKSLQRQIENVCGETGWSSWSTINSTSGAGTTSYNDTVNGGSCYQYRAQASSSGGTATSGTCGPVKVDTIPPTNPASLTVTGSSCQNSGGVLYCSISNPALSYIWPAASDAHSGIMGYQVVLQDSINLNWVTYDISTTTSASLSSSLINGRTYYTWVRAFDLASNWNTSFTKGNNVVIDTTVPVVTINDFGPINIANQTSLSLSGNCEAGLTVSLALRDSANNKVSATAGCSTGLWSANANISSLADGTITATASQTDLAGNQGSASKSATKDTTAPTGTININNNATYTASNTVTLNLTCSDLVSGCSQMTTYTDQNCSAGANTTGIEPSRTITWSGVDTTKWASVQFRDTVGNTTSCLNDSIIVDTATPTINSSISACDIFDVSYPGKNYTCSGSSTDTNQLKTKDKSVADLIGNVCISGCLVKVEIYKGANAVTPPKTISDTSSLGVELVANYGKDINGEYRVKLTPSNNAGTVGTVKELLLTVDNKAPVIFY